MKKTDDNKIECPECLGTRNIYDGEEFIKCPKCKGAGYILKDGDEEYFEDLDLSEVYGI